VDTLEYFPHNYQMPQLSSTDRLLMAAKNMTDAFQNPHPDVPFTSVGDDTIAALADLAAIFKLKLQHAPSRATHAWPPKVVQCQSHIPLSTQLLNSPIPPNGLRDPRRQFTTTTFPLGHYLRGWSLLGHYVIHLRGCPLAPGDSRLATCSKMTFAEWTQSIWRLPSGVIIGPTGTRPTESSTQSLERKCNTRRS
jgi:hypothetical protein